MLTPDQLEAAARRLCKLRGIDPDKVHRHTMKSPINGDKYAVETVAWEWTANEITARLQMDDALAGIEQDHS